MSEAPAPVRCVTKSVTIDRPAAEVHAYLADAANWPRWAVINVLAVEPSAEPGWWKITTAQGPGEIRIHADAATGVLDHDFRDDSETIFTVPARVVANGRGAEFLMTFLQPSEMSDDELDSQLELVETELATLKRVLERGRGDLVR
jgi:uncharacterized protein YndB with AHSA1/START domain